MKTLFRLAGAILLLGTATHGIAAASTNEVRFYIGTSTTGTSLGIYQSSLDLKTGTFGHTSLAAVTGSPMFLALTPDRRFLYALDRVAETIVAFSVDATNGSMTLLNGQPCKGGPCHVAVDRSGKNVIAANFTAGSVNVYPIGGDGRLGATTMHIQHPGAKPHAHCTTIDPRNDFVFICDMGLDQVRCYMLDPATGVLTSNKTFITPFKTGAGPRHMAFDPRYKRAYVICELDSTIVGFDYDNTNGALTPFQTVNTLPDGFKGTNTAAEIVVHPSGRFVYGSNRGHDSIAVFSVNPADGKLTLAQRQSVGKTPRNFAIDPTGAYCIVANQDSDDVRLYSIDQKTGRLTFTGQTLSVSKPVCILPFDGER